MESFYNFSIECWNCSDSVIYIFSFHYSFIPMSGCVGMGPSALIFPGVYFTILTLTLEECRRGVYSVPS
jgi:hypothetical protein